jgi:hypothetical protein
MLQFKTRPSRRRHSLPAENDVNGGEYQVELRAGQLSYSLRENASVQRHDLGRIRHGVSRKPRSACSEKDAPRRIPPAEVARQRNADDRAEAASVERIALNDHDRTAEPRRGPGWRWQIGPPHVAPGNHQSLRSSVSRAAAAAKASCDSPTASQTRSIAAVTSSGACLATYSRTARL